MPWWLNSWRTKKEVKLKVYFCYKNLASNWLKQQISKSNRNPFYLAILSSIVIVCVMHYGWFGLIFCPF